MVIQGLMASQMSMISTAVSNYSAKTEQANADFSATLNQNLKSEQKVETSTKKETVNNQPVDKNSEVSTAKVQNQNTNEKEQTVNTKADNTSSKEVMDDAVVDEELVENIEVLISNCIEIITQMLAITPEELEQMMTDLDMQPVDLLSQEGLTQIFLQQNGFHDVTDLLINQDAQVQLNDLLQTVKTAIIDADIKTPVEEFSSILHNFYEGKQDALQTQEINPKRQNDNSKAVKADVKEDDTSDAKTVSNNETKIEVHSSKKEDSKSGFDTKNDNLKPSMDTFIEHLVQAKPVTEASMEMSLERLTQYRDIVNQIVEQIKINISETHTTMQMNLNPENLGKVQVAVTSKNGVMNAQFMVQNEAAKEAIENQMNVLIKTFDEQGLKVEAVEVSVGDFSFNDNMSQQMSEGKEENHQGHQERRRITLEEAINMNDLTEDEQLIVDMMEINGNQVDFTA